MTRALRQVRRALAGLRFRIALLLVMVLIFAGVGFEFLLVSLTNRWLYEELDFRTRSVAALAAGRLATPMIVGDSTTLAAELRRAASMTDIVGVAVYDSSGRAIGSEAQDPAIAAALRARRPGGSAKLAPRIEAARFGERAVRQIALPMTLPGTFGAEREASGGFDASRARPAPHRPIGWVGVVASTQRVQEAVTTAAQMGIALLVAVLGLGLVALLLLIRVVVRPLREAGRLAREIAAGHLERRLPVRSRDELGALAISMNTMAGAVRDAQDNARVEAEALRRATAAMVAIAQGARTAQDPGSLFGVVAFESRRVTGCEVVALAITDATVERPRFTHFDPAPPWGGLDRDLPLDPEITARITRDPTTPQRLTPDDTSALARGLAAEGFVSALLVPLRQSNGPPAALVLAARDADAFTPSEIDVVGALATHLTAALHASTLHYQLEEAFGELHRTHEYLLQSEMLRMAGEMATGVAHEFNNVLGAILGRAQLVRRALDEGHLALPDLRSALDVIERAARDGSETGRRLRQFGLSGTRPLETLDLDRVVRDAVEFTRPRWENEAQAAGRRIEVEVDSGPGAWVEGRGNELREVFTNILLNAIDALPRGGTIRVATERRGEHVHAEVVDDGSGMTEDVRRRVFEPFFTTKGDQGTGLGMSVVYGIVEHHRGSISVSSQPGDGTRLTLEFPAAGVPATAAPASATADGAAGPLDVLVVDDDDAVRDVLRDMTAALGHRVVACASGEEALAGFERGRFQLVMTDLGMPGMTGWQLAEAIRGQDPEVTLAFVTGWGQDVDGSAAGRAGADVVIAKPFSIEDVAAIAQKAVDRVMTRAA